VVQKNSHHKTMNKLNYLKASYRIAGHFKDISKEIKSLAQHQNIAGVVQALINYLKTLQSIGQEAKLPRYICYVGMIYSRGNDYVRYMIENMFVRALGSLERRCSAAGWKAIAKCMPKPFTEIYIKQINE